MSEIRNVSIVSPTKILLYERGVNGIHEFTVDAKWVSADTKIGFISGRDKEGNVLVEISLLAPIVIERF